MDWRLLGFIAAAGGLVTFLFGLFPALRASVASPSEVLKSGGSKHTARAELFRPLLGAQTAFSFVVLFLATLCLTSFYKLLRTDVGFDGDNLAVMTVEARAFRQHGAEALPAWAQLLERLRESPGIESASLSGWGLFEGRGRNKAVRIPGRAADTYEILSGAMFSPRPRLP